MTCEFYYCLINYCVNSKCITGTGFDVEAPHLTSHQSCVSREIKQPRVPQISGEANLKHHQKLPSQPRNTATMSKALRILVPVKRVIDYAVCPLLPFRLLPIAFSLPLKSTMIVPNMSRLNPASTKPKQPSRLLA